jgi:hypothetical protein
MMGENLMTKRVLIKYGEKEHLEELAEGKIRFAPSQNYVKMEEELHNKGQGDLLEGKLVFYAENLKFTRTDTGERFCVPGKKRLLVNGQNVNNMPLFCISEYGEDYFTVDNKLCIPQDKIESIKKDFPRATHALIFLDADEFINSVRQAGGHSIYSDSIHYYDYETNDLNMMSFLSTGDEDAHLSSGIVTLSVTYEDRYRILLCKDKEFANQDEYRFVVLDELSDIPVFYRFNYSGKYLLLPIDSLLDPIDLR